MESEIWVSADKKTIRATSPVKNIVLCEMRKALQEKDREIEKLKIEQQLENIKLRKLLVTRIKEARDFLKTLPNTCNASFDRGYAFGEKNAYAEIQYFLEEKERREVREQINY